MLAAALVLLVAGVSAVLATREDSTGLVEGTTPTAAAGGALPADTTPTTAMSTAPDVLGPPLTIAAPMADIIPGFAYTDDIEIFLEQLEDDPDLVGAKGPDLVEKLGDLLDQNSARKQRDKARDLREELIEWVEDEELNAAIAEALDLLLEEFA